MGCFFARVELKQVKLFLVLPRSVVICIAMLGLVIHPPIKVVRSPGHALGVPDCPETASSGNAPIHVISTSQNPSLSSRQRIIPVTMTQLHRALTVSLQHSAWVDTPKTQSLARTRRRRRVVTPEGDNKTGEETTRGSTGSGMTQKSVVKDCRVSDGSMTT
jgi:hypothetical protein